MAQGGTIKKKLGLRTWSPFFFPLKWMANALSIHFFSKKIANNVMPTVTNDVSSA
jgi:hypothetical protein